MSKKEKRPEIGKIRRVLAAALSVMMLATSGFTSVLAQTPEVTAGHYPGSAGIVQKTNNSDAEGYMLCWQTPAITPSSTALYVLEEDKWTEIQDATPAGTTVTDLNALYKIVNTFEDGVVTEYIIQKNNSGTSYICLDGDTPEWSGATSRKFVGVTGADYAGTEEAGHSLKVTNWGPEDDKTYSLVTIITKNAKFDRTKDYKFSYDWKSSFETGMPEYIFGNGPIEWKEDEKSTKNEWHHKEYIFKDGVVSDYDYTYKNSGSFGVLAFNATKVTDAWIDNVEIYELDENGNVTGNNLLPEGDFELASGATAAPLSSLANIRYDGIAGGVILNWAKKSAAIATRVYNAEGCLIAELGDATELPLTGLTDGESYTYELRSVYAGGYESEGKTVTVTAGIPQKPQISEYYPINLFARYRPYDDGKGGTPYLVKIMWMNPDLNGRDLTSVKIYDISGSTPVEKSTVSAIDLTGGAENEAVVADTTNCQANLYRVDFAYDDGTKVSYTTQASNVLYTIQEKWGLDDATAAHVIYGQETNFSHSGDASIMLHHYWKTTSRLIYDNNNPEGTGYDKANGNFVAGKQYEVSFWYKTLLGSNRVADSDQYATFKALGNDIRIDCNDSYDWTQVKQVITASESDTNIAIYTDSSCNAALWVDDISIREIDSTTSLATGDNLIENGSFDEKKDISEIYDATYTGINGGAIIKWTRNSNRYKTNVYLDGVRIASVNDVAATLPVTGLENGKKYTIALKEVTPAGREYNGAYITIVAGEGNGTDLYKPEGITVKETAAGVNIAWYNPWNELSDVLVYDVTDNKAVELKKAVALDSNNAEVELGTPEKTLESGRYNYLTVVDSKGVKSHVYKLIFTFKDGTVREFYSNAAHMDPKQQFSAWETLGPKVDIVHHGYTNDAIGENAFTFGRYHYSYLGEYPDTGLFYKELDGKIKAGKTYRVAFKMKGKNMMDGNTIALEGNTLNTAGNHIKFYAAPSKNWLQYYFDIPVTELTDKETYIRVNGVPYMMIDDFAVYELDENGIVVKQIEISNGDFEEELTLGAVTDLKAESAAGNIKLSWTLPDNAVGANVYADGIQIASIRGSKLELTDLKAGEEYSYEVRAINRVGYEAEGVCVSANVETLIAKNFNIYDYNGDVITSLGIPTEYTVKASLSNYGTEPKEVMIVYAMYDSSDRLHTCKQTTKTIEVGAEDEEISVSYMTDFWLPDDVSYAKIFLWDMTEGMKPLGNTAKLANAQ